MEISQNFVAFSEYMNFNRKPKESGLSMFIFSLVLNMDSSIDMDSSQTRSNGDESRAGAEELRKNYHHLSNSLAECSIDPNHALEQATEMLEKVNTFKLLSKVVWYILSRQLCKKNTQKAYFRSLKGKSSKKYVVPICFLNLEVQICVRVIRPKNIS